MCVGAGSITKKLIGADGEETEKTTKRKGAKVELYRSVMQFTKSDHKPVASSSSSSQSSHLISGVQVTAIIALPRHPKGARALRLPFAAPFLIDPLWRQKQLVGWLLDRFVGFFWCLLMLAGFNRNLKCVPSLSQLRFVVLTSRSQVGRDESCGGRACSLVLPSHVVKAAGFSESPHSVQRG